jgi:hypothetical protein
VVSNPSEKYESVGMIIPNHQPGVDCWHGTLNFALNLLVYHGITIRYPQNGMCKGTKIRIKQLMPHHMFHGIIYGTL